MAFGVSSAGVNKSKVSAHIQEVPRSFYVCAEALKGLAATGQMAESAPLSTQQRVKAFGVSESRAHMVARFGTELGAASCIVLTTDWLMGDKPW